ncbi:OmpA family protein [Burkholderia ubonensis]|uniref:OmpA family protein n=1 Tax=Burkholderia ubonensis TaxID=101571 RepID=A0AB74DEJ4_9BURK|nr:OmpA family protein [Burkholderia ubonensis]PAJ78957.1 flagellar motor protein MotB [Burkholderia ubonensis]PAJ90086.1 flagellar motor protein MotB [Burkholderia ubonensis]PAJ96286.1 flagellar motor protein MotB [Burkholderia ubonensis]PAK02991.1 flagellar motor protein MotB [Burkholderia ubonensis]PAK07623.1 flagellar motor protein MotB [Burkholderia ubonensis]
MSSDLYARPDTPGPESHAARATLAGLGYPLRTVVTLTAVLALAVIWLVLSIDRGAAWGLTAAIVAVSLLVGWRHMRKLARLREQHAHVLTQLGAATVDLPVGLRTRMPVALVVGDGLASLFDREDTTTRYVHVGNGAIWLRVDQPQDLSRLAVAIRQWRDGHAPDCVVLSVAPAMHANSDVLAQRLRVIRQAAADASKALGTALPGYVAIYQRLTGDSATSPTQFGDTTAQWYGASAASPIVDAHRFDAAIEAAESEVVHAGGNRVSAARAAGLAAIVAWTQRNVFDVLADRRQPAPVWRLFGAGWIDCGPETGPGKPWERDVRTRIAVAPRALPGSTTPWPLPQPLIEAAPQRAWRSPRIAAVGHAFAIVACATAVAIWGAAKNNEALLTRIGEHLARYNAISATHDAAKRDALRALVADRDQLDRHARTGVPLRLSFGMYHGRNLLSPLNDAIASYEPPSPPPSIVTLDSMSLFDSGKAALKPDSTRAMVGALELIKAHPGKRILVAGHTDDVGKPDRNLKLSVDRAAAVRDWLVDASGIPTTQFAIQGYGDTRPVADNATPEDRARNRRVEITLVPDAPAKMPSGNPAR